VRDPSNTAALQKLKSGKGSELIIVKLDAKSTTDAADAVALLKSKHNITHIDVVIANAGIGQAWGPALTLPIEDFLEHYQVNAGGTLLLFQAVHDLLSASKNPKFVAIGTPVGSIGEIEKFPLPATAYGSSKAGLHYLVRKLHFEHENVTIYPLTPG
jgi:norsolorinic acid ketoreductase